LRPPLGLRHWAASANSRTSCIASGRRTSSADAAAGVAKDACNAQLFAENLANAHTSLFTNADQYIVANTPMRPRIIGVKFRYSF
jgi:hypothetical protein